MSRAKDIEAIVVYLQSHWTMENAYSKLYSFDIKEFIKYEIRERQSRFGRSVVFDVLKSGYAQQKPIHYEHPCRSWNSALRRIARDLLDNWPVVAREIIRKVKVE